MQYTPKKQVLNFSPGPVTPTTTSPHLPAVPFVPFVQISARWVLRQAGLEEAVKQVKYELALD